MIQRVILPKLSLSLLVVLGYLYSLSQTTYYYSGEDGAWHITKIWFVDTFLSYMFFIVMYWILKISLLKLGKKSVENFYAKLFLGIILSVFFVVLLLAIGAVMLGLHFENSYWSEGEFDPNLHLQPIYYFHIPIYVMCVFIFDWVVNKLFRLKPKAH